VNAWFKSAETYSTRLNGRQSNQLRPYFQNPLQNGLWTLTLRLCCLSIPRHLFGPLQIC
jgi:hypothetical protein